MNKFLGYSLIFIIPAVFMMLGYTMYSESKDRRVNRAYVQKLCTETGYVALTRQGMLSIVYQCGES